MPISIIEAGVPRKVVQDPLNIAASSVKAIPSPNKCLGNLRTIIKQANVPEKNRGECGSRYWSIAYFLLLIPPNVAAIVMGPIYLHDCRSLKFMFLLIILIVGGICGIFIFILYLLSTILLDSKTKKSVVDDCNLFICFIWVLMSSCGAVYLEFILKNNENISVDLCLYKPPNTSLIFGLYLVYIWYVGGSVIVTLGMIAK